MNTLLWDKQFLVLWIKNFLEIERISMASQKAGDLGSTEERHNKSFDISPRTPERKENTLFSASIPTDSENMHDGAIIEDPRFRGILKYSNILYKLFYHFLTFNIYRLWRTSNKIKSNGNFCFLSRSTVS